MKKTDIRTRPLLSQEKAFVDAYDGGDPYPAVVAAGYSGTVDSLVAEGFRLLKIPAIRRAIRAKQYYEPNILEEIEVLEGLTNIALDPKERTQDRLKAYEMYGKTKGMFIDVRREEKVSLEELITKAGEDAQK